MRICALHVACKFNNKEMVNEITQRGVSIEFLIARATPTALCLQIWTHGRSKYLIDAGASILAKNMNNQRPYDIAESHDPAIPVASSI